MWVVLLVSSKRAVSNIQNKSAHKSKISMWQYEVVGTELEHKQWHDLTQNISSKCLQTPSIALLTSHAVAQIPTFGDFLQKFTKELFPLFPVCDLSHLMSAPPSFTSDGKASPHFSKFPPPHPWSLGIQTQDDITLQGWWHWHWLYNGKLIVNDGQKDTWGHYFLQCHPF